MYFLRSAWKLAALGELDPRPGPELALVSEFSERLVLFAADGDKIAEAPLPAQGGYEGLSFVQGAHGQALLALASNRPARLWLFALEGGALREVGAWRDPSAGHLRGLVSLPIASGGAEALLLSVGGKGQPEALLRLELGGDDGLSEAGRWPAPDPAPEGSGAVGRLVALPGDPLRVIGWRRDRQPIVYRWEGGAPRPELKLPIAAPLEGGVAFGLVVGAPEAPALYGYSLEDPQLWRVDRRPVGALGAASAGAP